MRTILKPDRDVLFDQVVNQHLPMKVLSYLHGYKDVSNLYHWCKVWNIPLPVYERPTDWIRKIDLTDKQRELVYGTMLGDGYISPLDTKRNSCLVMSQSEKQAEYLNWKAGVMRPFVVSPFPTVSKQRGWDDGLLYSFRTVRHPIFTKFRKVFYPDGKKEVSRDWLNLLSPLSIAVWIMDDGSYHYTRGYITLCTNSFSYDEHLVMQTYFQEIWNIKSAIHKVKRGRQFTLVFNRPNSQRLIDLVGEFIIPSMHYKIGIRP